MDPLRRCALSRLCLGATLACLAHATGGRAADGDTQRQIRQLQEQNETFQLQLRKQQGLIEQLSRQLAGLQGASEAAPSTAAAEATTRASQAFSPGKVRLSGEFALGLFHSQSAGQFPNAEFRVDEAKIFVEAPIWGEVYFFTELNLFTREEAAGELRVGELYVDVENLSRRWNKESQLNLRVGRMDIPFG